MKLFILLVFFLSGSAFAQQKYNFHLGLSYNDRLEKVNGTDRINVTTTIYNVGFGADFDNGLYAGFKYYQYTEAWGDNRDEDKIVSGPGLSIGYFHNSGFTILATYLWEPTKEYPNASGGRQEYSGGSGTVIDIAYLINNGNYAIGPMITQANIDYKKIKTPAGTVDTNGSTEDIHVFPYLVLFFYL